MNQHALVVELPRDSRPRLGFASGNLTTSSQANLVVDAPEGDEPDRGEFFGVNLWILKFI